MNLRDLQYVCAVAEAKHFGKASVACHVSQPTLSGQIRNLEDHLGVELFERTTRSVRLTSVGRRIVEIALSILKSAREIEATAAAHRDPTSGTLRLGIIPTIAPYLIPLFVGPLRRRFPSLTVALVEETTDPLLERLKDGDIEAAIVATSPGDKQLSSIPLYREPFWLALPRGHVLERHKRIDPRKVDSKELLLLADGHCLREQALAVCGAGTLSNPTDTTATSLETILNLVAAGHGITLVPALALASGSRPAALVLRPAKSKDAQRLVRLAHRRGFTHKALLESIGALVRGAVPDTVTPVTD
jgi:LysR family hydrogen peroxide-inducible transcriptional activator